MIKLPFTIILIRNNQAHVKTLTANAAKLLTCV